MRIGLTFDSRTDISACHDLPDDFQEEFDSPRTIEAIAAVLRDLGHEVELLGDGREMIERLLDAPPEFVFNLAEGQGIGRAREARVPAVLEMLDIPYSGSDPLTLAVTLDKDCAKRIVHSAGIAVPTGVVVGPERLVPEAISEVELHFPVIVKPAWEGSSKGIREKSLVDDPVTLAGVIEDMRRDYRQPVLVEEYIEGDELTVGVLGNNPAKLIGIMKVLPEFPTERFVYSLEVKRDFERQVRYECPARLSNADTASVAAAALEAFAVLGCRDVSRVDFRLRDGVPYFLEVNPLPGLNPYSGDIVIMSKLAGWKYEELIAAILESAVARCHGARRIAANAACS
jgi:D-alanine-D-alanine ligase